MLFQLCLVKTHRGQWDRDLWRRVNPHSSEFTHYNRSSGTRSRVDKVYTDINIARNTKIYGIMVSFTDHYNAISIDHLQSKTKTRKNSCYFHNSLLWKSKFSRATNNLFFIKNTKNDHSSTSDWSEYAKSCFKRNARTFSKNSTTQKNIWILRLKKRLRSLYIKENFKP